MEAMSKAARGWRKTPGVLLVKVGGSPAEAWVQPVSAHTQLPHFSKIQLSKAPSAFLQPARAKCSGLRTQVQGQLLVAHILSLTAPILGLGKQSMGECSEG